MTKHGLLSKALFRALASETDECIIWTYALASHRYPHMAIDGKMQRLTGIVCEAYRGPKPPGHEAAHSCHDTRCINKRHLSWQLHATNMAASYTKGEIDGTTSNPQS
jgi:hypothetical protein